MLHWCWCQHYCRLAVPLRDQQVVHAWSAIASAIVASLQLTESAMIMRSAPRPCITCRQAELYTSAAQHLQTQSGGQVHAIPMTVALPKLSELCIQEPQPTGLSELS